MAIEGVELQFQKAVDRWAWLREGYIRAAVGGVNFWTLVDAATGDGLEEYQNWCGTWDVSETDDLLAAASLGDTSAFVKWANAHNSWIKTAVAASRPGLGYASWAAYFGLLLDGTADLGKFWRVPHSFAELFYDKYGARLGTINVGAKGVFTATIGTNVAAGLHDFGQFAAVTAPDPGVFTANEGDLDDTKTVGSPILWNSNSSGGDVVATITVKRAVNVDKVWAGVDMTGAANVAGVIGEIAMTSGEVAGVTVLRATTCPAASVMVGDHILIYESDELQEIGEVASMTTNTSVTLKKGLRHTYTNAAKIRPLYTGITSVVGTAGTNGKLVDFYARPDRTVTYGS